MRGVLAGQHARVRIQLPLVACSEHSNPGAFWATVLRVIPRTFSALLANCGISVPHLHHTRIRFVQLERARRARDVPALETALCVTSFESFESILPAATLEPAP